MKTAIDFMPLALYLAAYVAFDIYVATAVLVAAMAAQLAYWKIARGAAGRLAWLNFTLALAFGGLTIAWNDPQYLVLRATAIYLFVSAALVLAYWIGRRNLVQMALGPRIDAPEAAWRRSLYAYAAFFAVLAAVNLLIGYTASEAVWVGFDTIGVLVLIAGFATLHFIGMRRRYEDAAGEAAGNQ